MKNEFDVLKRNFDEDGFVIVENLLDAAMLENLRQDFTEANTIVAILCLDDMAGENGGTQFVRASHKISEQEAQKEIWRDVEKDKLPPEEIVTARCPAGSGVFFDTKVLYATGHNRSPFPRRTIQIEWVGVNDFANFSSSIRFSRFEAAPPIIGICSTN